MILDTLLFRQILSQFLPYHLKRKPRFSYQKFRWNALFLSKISEILILCKFPNSDLRTFCHLAPSSIVKPPSNRVVVRCYIEKKIALLCFQTWLCCTFTWTHTEGNRKQELKHSHYIWHCLRFEVPFAGFTLHNIIRVVCCCTTAKISHQSHSVLFLKCW